MMWTEVWINFLIIHTRLISTNTQFQSIYQNKTGARFGTEINPTSFENVNLKFDTVLMWLHLMRTKMKRIVCLEVTSTHNQSITFQSLNKKRITLDRLIQMNLKKNAPQIRQFCITTTARLTFIATFPFIQRLIATMRTRTLVNRKGRLKFDTLLISFLL